MYKVSKPTLYSDMQNGKISYERDARNKRRLNIAELERVYEKRKVAVEPGSKQTVNLRHEKTESDVQQDALRIEKLEMELSYLKHDLENKENQLKQWKEAFDKAQATADKITALIENRRDVSKIDDEHEKKIQILEETLRKMETRNSQIIRKLQAQEKRQQKSFWARLVGT